jgi:hypothetical protein
VKRCDLDWAVSWSGFCSDSVELSGSIMRRYFFIGRKLLASQGRLCCVVFIVVSLTHSWSWAVLEKPPIVQLSRTSQHFMEPEGSLLCSQEPSTGPCPEPDKSNPSHYISLRSILILSAHLHLGLPSGLIPFSFPTNILYAFLLFSFVLHVLPISSYLSWSFYYTWRRV